MGRGASGENCAEAGAWNPLSRSGEGQGEGRRSRPRGRAPPGPARGDKTVWRAGVFRRLGAKLGGAGETGGAPSPPPFSGAIVSFQRPAGDLSAVLAAETPRPPAQALSSSRATATRSKSPRPRRPEPKRPAAPAPQATREDTAAFNSDQDIVALAQSKSAFSSTMTNTWRGAPSTSWKPSFRGSDPVNGARSARRLRRSETIDRVRTAEGHASMRPTAWCVAAGDWSDSGCGSSSRPSARASGPSLRAGDADDVINWEFMHVSP